MKNKIKIIILVIMLLSISAIATIYISQNTFIEAKQTCVLDNNVKQMLTYMKIDNCKLNTIGDYSDISFSFDKVSITQEDIDKYIASILKMFDTSQKVTDRNVVQINDLIYMNYDVIYNNQELNHVTDASVLVGSGNFDKQIEQLLIGAKLDKTFESKATIPADDNSAYAGKECTLRITVTSINTILPCKLTDAFVQKNYDCENVQDFYEYVQQTLENEKSNELRSKVQNEILQQIINKSDFDLDSEQITVYALETVNGYKDLASGYGMDLEKYRKEILHLTEDEFFEQCYKETETFVKEYLIIGAIADDKSIVLEQEEIDSYLRKNGYSLSEKENTENLCYLTYQLLRNKVYSFIMNNAKVS